MIGLPGQHWLGCLSKKFDTAKKSSSGSTNKVLPESRAPKPVKVRVLYLRLGVCASEQYLGVGQVTQWLFFHTINIKNISKAISMNPFSPVKEECFCNQKNQGVNPPPSRIHGFFPQPRAARSDWPFFESVTLRPMATVHMVKPTCIGYLAQATNISRQLVELVCTCCLWKEMPLFGMHHEVWWNLEQRGQAAHAISDGGGHPATPCEIQMPWMVARRPEAWQTPQVLGTQNLY